MFLKRMGTLLFLAAFFFLLPVGNVAAQNAAPTMPMTGAPRPEFAAVDQAMIPYMEGKGIPGAHVSIRLRGRLLYSRGYGYADVEARKLWDSSTRSRIASVNKPITATAVLQLVQEGKLKLEDKVFQVLGYEPFLRPGTQVDPRIYGITVQQLLNHTGGWANKYEPLWNARDVADEMKVTSPPSARDLARYMMGRPLEFEPGSRYGYSNMGYLLLGEVIAKLSGTTCESYVQSMLGRMGIRDVQLGRTLLKYRASNEAKYYLQPNPMFHSVFAEDGFASGPYQYGGFPIEAMVGHGGLIASGDSLTKFACELAFPSSRPILSSQMLTRMVAPPPNGVRMTGLNAHYGAGWIVTSGPTVSHSGSLGGACSYLTLRNDGIAFSILANGGKELDGNIVDQIHGILNDLQKAGTMPVGAAR